MTKEKRELFEKCLVRVNKIRAGAVTGSIHAVDIEREVYEVFDDIYLVAFEDGWDCGVAASVR